MKTQIAGIVKASGLRYRGESKANGENFVS